MIFFAIILSRISGQLDRIVSLKEGIEHGNVEKTIAEFSKAVEHFSRIMV
jgi:hypothetical protein